MQSSSKLANLFAPPLLPIYNTPTTQTQSNQLQPSLLRSICQTPNTKAHKPKSPILQYVTINDSTQEAQLIKNLRWRQQTSMPVRKVSGFSEQKNPQTGAFSEMLYPKYYEIKAEKIETSLQILEKVTLPQALYIISEFILGYQALRYQFRQRTHSWNVPSQITLTNCGFNQIGQLIFGTKLWKHSRESQKIDFKQKQAILQIGNLVLSHTSGLVFCEISSLMIKLKDIPQVSYNFALALIRSFAQEKNVAIPRQIWTEIIQPKTNYEGYIVADLQKSIRSLGFEKYLGKNNRNTDTTRLKTSIKRQTSPQFMRSCRNIGVLALDRLASLKVMSSPESPQFLLSANYDNHGEIQNQQNMNRLSVPCQGGSRISPFYKKNLSIVPQFSFASLNSVDKSKATQCTHYSKNSDTRSNLCNELDSQSFVIDTHQGFSDHTKSGCQINNFAKSLNTQIQQLNNSDSQQKLPKLQPRLIKKKSSSATFTQENEVNPINGILQWAKNIKLFPQQSSDDLKESIYCEQEGSKYAQVFDNLTNLEKLGKLGRKISNSILPIPQKEEVQISFVVE